MKSGVMKVTAALMILWLGVCGAKNVALVVGGLGGGSSIEIITKDHTCANDVSVPALENAPAGQLDGWVAEYVDNQIVLCGGQDIDIHRDCFSLVIGANRWQQACSLEVDRRYASSLVTPDGRMLVIGGYNNKIGWLDSIEVRSAGQCGFSLMEEWKMPKPLFHTCAVMISDTELMLIGGSTKGQAQTDGVFILDISTSEWTVAPSIPGPRQAAGCLLTEVDGVPGVMVTGGLNKLTHYRSTHFFSLEQRVWTELRNMKEVRMGHQMFNVDGVPTVIGGYSDHLIANIESFIDGVWTPQNHKLKFGRYQYGGIEVPEGLIKC